MKKIMIVAAVSAVIFASCNNAEVKKETEKAPAKEEMVQKIAYVEVDSIMTQYQFCKDNKAILEKKGKNIQATLASKQQNLERAAAKFQQDLQANKYTQQQAEAVQAGLQKQNRDLQALQQRLSADFDKETMKFNQALGDSIQHFLAQYNKSKKYAMIISKAGDNILYADQKYNITKEIVAGLNKAYKPVKK